MVVFPLRYRESGTRIERKQRFVVPGLGGPCVLAPPLSRHSARQDVPMSHALDPDTLRSVIAKDENHRRELEGRTGECSTCRSADLRLHLGEQRALLGGGRFG